MRLTKMGLTKIIHKNNLWKLFSHENIHEMIQECFTKKDSQKWISKNDAKNDSQKMIHKNDSQK